jgi:hypothetical protein
MEAAMSRDSKIDDATIKEVEAGIDAAMRGLFELFKDAPHRPEHRFIKYDIVQDGDKVRWVINADDLEFRKMWRDVFRR